MRLCGTWCRVCLCVCVHMPIHVYVYREFALMMMENEKTPRSEFGKLNAEESW